jgi:hypothetical integral membrane protein (TIGR02206 family)
MTPVDWEWEMTALLSVPFVAFGPSHKAVLALIVVVPLVLSVLVRVAGSATLSRAISWGLALVITGTWVAWYIVFTQMGWINLGNALPLDLCSWAAIATIVALATGHQKAYELAWFWAMAGTVQGIVTPNIPDDFPAFRFIEFSLFHGGIIAGVLFLTLGRGMRVYARSIPRVIAWTVAYAAIAGLADWLLGVNYGFLRAKPVNASLYDLMPAWPWYIPIVVALALVAVGVCYLPFLIYDAVAPTRKKA